LRIKQLIEGEALAKSNRKLLRSMGSILFAKLRQL
jgi:hypothetical protein